MQYKNIIFDLGNVLVKLNPEGCIGAFKAIEMGELANPNPQSEGMKLMSKLGVGMITTEAFCDAARELTGADVTNRSSMLPTRCWWRFLMRKRSDSCS